MARDIGEHPQPAHLARHRRRIADRKRRGGRTYHLLGSDFPCQMHHTYRGNFLERTHAYWPQNAGWRPLCRACLLSSYRIHRPPWHYLRTDEDRYPCPNRCQERPFRTHGDSRRRERFPSFFVYQRAQKAQAIAMLDMFYQRRITRNSSQRTI